MMLQKKVGERAIERQVAPQRDGARSEEPTLHRAVGDRRSVGAVRQLRSSDAFRPVSNGFTPVVAGSALGTDAAGAGDAARTSRIAAAQLESVGRRARGSSSAPPSSASTSCGVRRRSSSIARSVHDIIQWLHDDPSQRYDYLSDVTAVEFRDLEQPIEVVWHLRSLPFRRFLRVKVLIAKGAALEVPSVWDIYKGADWLERECYDMFGISFTGHPDLRRLLMWEQYKEGYPLRKDFPLRGRFSRSEQLRQALAANPEARYSKDELSIADAFEDLPSDMQRRLGDRREGRESRHGDHETHGRSRALHHRPGCAGPPAARAARRGRERRARRRRSAAVDRAGSRRVSTCSSTSGRSIRRRTACCASCSSSTARRSCGASRTSATCTAASRRSASTGSTTRSSRGPTVRIISTRPATTSRSRSARSGCSASRSRSGARCCA